MQAEQGPQIEEVILPVLRDHGLELVDLEWRPRRPRGVLRVYVDKPGGVRVDDCERLSRELGDVLDASDLMDAGYDLEVSSPGLDRLLRSEREYRWAVGKRLRCWLVGGGEVQGRLDAVDVTRLVIEQGGERVMVARAEIARARLEPEVPWQRRAQG